MLKKGLITEYALPRRSLGSAVKNCIEHSVAVNWWLSRRSVSSGLVAGESHNMRILLSYFIA